MANSDIDKLKALSKNSNDSIKTKAFCDLCWEYRRISSDSALFFGNKALEIARLNKNNSGIAQAYNDIGILYLDKGELDTALVYFSNSLALRKQISDSMGMASSFNKIGIVYQKRGDLKAALNNQISALKIYELINNQLYIAYSQNNIAIINFNLGDYQKSLEYHKNALETRKILKDDYGIANSYGNIANVLLAVNDTTEAIKNYSQSLEIFRKLENKEAVAVQLSNLGSIFLSKNENIIALEYLKEALKLRQSLQDEKAIASSMLKIGNVYLNLNIQDSALKYYSKARTISEKINVVDEKIQSYLGLSKLFILNGMPDSSNRYLNEYIAQTDSLYQSRLEEQIVDARTKYEVDRQEKDLELLRSETALKESKLKQRKTEIWLLISTIISISGAAIFVIYRRRQIHHEKMEKERELHAKKMMAAVIESQEKERRKIARELHDGVGQSLSALKLNLSAGETKKPKMIDMLDNAVDYVRNISHQMLPKELEQYGLLPAIEGFLDVRMKNSGINYNFEHLGINQRFGSHLELSLFRIIQELCGNVVKHSNANNLDIQLIKRKKLLVLMVVDDGKGISTEKLGKGGIGLMNIESRVNSLNGFLNFGNSENGKGTEVLIRIPLNE